MKERTKAKERKRETVRQRDKDTNREKERQANRLAEIKRDRQTEKRTNRGKAERQTETETATWRFPSIVSRLGGITGSSTCLSVILKLFSEVISSSNSIQKSILLFWNLFSLQFLYYI